MNSKEDTEGWEMDLWQNKDYFEVITHTKQDNAITANSIKARPAKQRGMNEGKLSLGI